MAVKKLDVEFKEGMLIARPEGELDLRVADFLRKELEQAIKHYPLRHLVLNLSRVTYIDSSCLGVILGRYKRLAQEGVGISLVGLQPQVRRVCELSGLLRIMAEYSTEEEAVAKGRIRGALP